MADRSQRSLERHEERLAWIFGSSRSGSTWLLRMLSDFEGIVPIDDPHLGHHLGVWRPIPARLSGIGTGTALGRSAAARSPSPRRARWP